MVYDHSRKAGNRGDVWKHFILLSVVEAFANVSHVSMRTFRYMDTHCGAPCHQLENHRAWIRGLGLVLPPREELAGYPYFRIVSASVLDFGRYLGSWSFVSRYLGSQGIPYKLELYDLSPTVAAAVNEAHGCDSASKVEFSQEDGFRAVERSDEQDLILIDPPYTPNPASHWAACRKIARLLNRRAVPYLMWYPIFCHVDVQKLLDTCGWPGFEVVWQKADSGVGEGLPGCGMVAANGCDSVLESVTGSLELLADELGGRFVIRR